MGASTRARRSTLTLDAQRSTFDARRSTLTLDAQRSTFDARRSTLDARRSTLDARRSRYWRTSSLAAITISRADHPSYTKTKLRSRLPSPSLSLPC